MQGNQAIEYQNWLRELKETDDSFFVIEFIKFFDYLSNNNLKKTKELISACNQESEKLRVASDKATKELEPLLNQIRELLNKSNVQEPYVGIWRYDKLVDEMLYSSSQPIEILYHAIRESLEMYINRPLPLNEFEDILTPYEIDVYQPQGDTIKEKNYYLDSEKFKNKFPIYASASKIIEKFDKDKKNSAWGAYYYLNWAKAFFSTTTIDLAGQFVKNDIISNLKTLIYFINSKPEKVDINNPNLRWQVKGLYSLSSDPPSIKYEGVNSKTPKWKNTKGKTQTYSLLRLAYEKHVHDKQKSGVENKIIKLSYSEIIDCLMDTKLCDRQPNWQSTDTNKRKLDSICKNMVTSFGFSNQEVSVQGKDNDCCLIFTILRK